MTVRVLQLSLREIGSADEEVARTRIEDPGPAGGVSRRTPRGHQADKARHHLLNELAIGQFII
eukprot:6201074-Heterocapsa_arctica.AAC.1